MTDARRSLPEVHASPSIVEWLRELAAKWPLGPLERAVLSEDASVRRLVADAHWRSLALLMGQHWTNDDHVILRGLPVDDDGVVTLLLSTLLCSRFRSYRSNQVVKHFKMSPWTTELSQTLKDGHFHTDLNTDGFPPHVTVIHCRKPDPSPEHGIMRVVRLSDLLSDLRDRGRHSTLRFMCEAEVEMVNERARGSWAGAIVQDSTVRFHPETLRAAARRGGKVPPDLESHLDAIHESALAVSAPFVLTQGDALLVSNTRALHYRGECTARFFDFPRGFEAREIFVLHLVDEPRWPT